MHVQVYTVSLWRSSNWIGLHSYTRTFIPSRQLISKEINCPVHEYMYEYVPPPKKKIIEFATPLLPAYFVLSRDN